MVAHGFYKYTLLRRRAHFASICMLNTPLLLRTHTHIHVQTRAHNGTMHTHTQNNVNACMQLLYMRTYMHNENRHRLYTDTWCTFRTISGITGGEYYNKNSHINISTTHTVLARPQLTRMTCSTYFKAVGTERTSQQRTAATVSTTLSK